MTLEEVNNNIRNLYKRLGWDNGKDRGDACRISTHVRIQEK